MFLTKKSSRLTKRERYSDNIPIKDPLERNEMFDLFFGYRFYQTRVIYDRIRKGGKKKEMKNFSHRETFSWANMATKEWHLFLFYTRKFSRLATYYVTYIRSSNDTHH